MTDAEVSRLLQAAANAQRSGDTRAAIRHLEAVLAIAPDHAIALNSIGVHALDTGDASRAAALFGRATAADPAAAPLWMNLAKAQRALRDGEGERASLTRVLEIDQRDFMGLVRMAELHQRLGEDARAVGRWVGVLALAAQMPGRGAELDALLARAGAFVERHNRGFAQAIDAGLAEARATIGGTARRRFDACIDHALGRREIYANRCEGTYYPFLPADEYFDAHHFPWMAELEAQTATIADELAALLRDDGAGFVPYVAQIAGTPQNKWTALDGSSAWGAYYLWKMGVRDDPACAACPATAAIVEALPLADMPGRTPTVFFSLLRPHTRIPPHTGVSNTRAIVHLPLLVPPGCGFRVGGETREWRVGQAFAFDDTIEHEAWNDSDAPRVVLIFDVWNPHLDTDERALLRTFYRIAGTSGFNPDA